MSELTKLTSKFDLLSKAIEDIKSKTGNLSDLDQSSIRVIVSQLSNYRDELANLSGIHAKLESKLKIVDPVTGEKRYGAATEAKILALGPALTTLLSDADHLQSVFSPLLVSIDIPLQVEEVVVDTVDSEAEEMRLAELEKQRLAQEAEELELNRRAQIIRDRKAQEQQQQELYEKQIEDKLSSIQAFANSSGLDSATVLNRIQQYATEHVDQKKVIVDMLKTISSILEAIISRPDNIALRKLRLTHPALKVKIVEVQCGIELLLALGFRMVVSKVPSTSSSSGVANSTIDRILQYGSGSGSIEVFSDILHLLTPHTKWDCVLEMEEPSVTVSTTSVAGKDDWITWFDKLSADRELLSSALKAI